MSTQPQPPAPPELHPPIRLLVALSALCATLHPLYPAQPGAAPWLKQHGARWLSSVLKLLDISRERLPGDVSAHDVQASAADQVSEWTAEQKVRIAGVLVEASLAAEGNKEKKEDALKYLPLDRAFAHRTLELLGVGTTLLQEAEQNLSTTLFDAMKATTDDRAKNTVEATREKHSEGWGGLLGRRLATGAGVIAGGVLIGVTGGLAAPAIGALLAPLGIGGLLAGGAAPVVLGTLFGVGGGGLAGRRVKERWKGVEEFGFVEIGAGTKVTKEEVEDLREVRKRLGLKQKEAREKGEKVEDATSELEKLDVAQKPDEQEHNKADEKVDVKEETEEKEMSDADKTQQVEQDRMLLEEKLLQISSQAGVQTSPSVSPRVSLDSGRPSLDGDGAETLTDVKKPPSLTATIVVPGLLTVSKTEGVTAWRAICARSSTAENRYEVRHAAPAPAALTTQGAQPLGSPLESGAQTDTPPKLLGLQDGRDVYLLKYETAAMLKTGRDIEYWVAGKIKGKIKGEIIKRTVLSAYFAAVKLPMTVYGMGSMALDNTWIHATDRARKAGRILGEVLEKRVQGERPVILIGSSTGALTILHALLYLASLPPESPARSNVPQYVESAFLISLPAAPTEAEWAKCRSVVARRLVNAYSTADWVLGIVARMHETVSRAVTLEDGTQPAGLGPVQRPGVQDVDVSSVIRGHMELHTKMGEVLRVLDVDA